MKERDEGSGGVRMWGSEKGKMYNRTRRLYGCSEEKRGSFLLCDHAVPRNGGVAWQNGPYSVAALEQCATIFFARSLQIGKFVGSPLAFIEILGRAAKRWHTVVQNLPSFCYSPGSDWSTLTAIRNPLRLGDG